MALSSIRSCNENRTRRHDWEPSISEILSDPIVKAVMQADGVDAKVLRTQLRRVAAGLTNSG
jgi:hypothetical protein